MSAKKRRRTRTNSRASSFATKKPDLVAGLSELDRTFFVLRNQDDGGGCRLRLWTLDRVQIDHPKLLRVSEAPASLSAPRIFGHILGLRKKDGRIAMLPIISKKQVHCVVALGKGGGESKRKMEIRKRSIFDQLGLLDCTDDEVDCDPEAVATGNKEPVNELLICLDEVLQTDLSYKALDY